MLDNIQHFKNNFLFKKTSLKKYCSIFNGKYLILLLTGLLTNIYVRHIYECKELELAPYKDIYDKIALLKNNTFVKAHNLNSDSEKFIQYMEQYFDNKKAKIINIKAGELNNISSIKIIPIEIDCSFIHDKFIFEFINKINQYEGFARTIAVKINKKELNNGYHILETVIVCTLYTK